MKASPTLLISVESRSTRLSLAVTFGALAVASLATTVPNVTGPKYACIAAVQPTQALFVLRLFQASVKLLQQVQRSPPHQPPVIIFLPPSAVPKPSSHSHSPPIPPNAHIPPLRRPPSHQPPQPRPQTLRGDRRCKIS